MILTITMNPSIDVAYQIDDFQVDRVNRSFETHKTAGGKGLNVTRVLDQLGDNVLATGFLGGKLGDFLEENLDKSAIKHHFYRISGETRNCIAVLHQGQQTEILESGPEVSEEEGRAFLNHLETCLAGVNAVVISGSLPKGLSQDYYSGLVELCASHRIPVVLDSSGQPLLSVLKGQYKPTVIKPNLEELSQLLKTDVSADNQELKALLSEDLFEGIEWIIVSLGAQGSFAKHGAKFYRVTIPKITVVNPVGSGDSTVAGIASALVGNLSDVDLLKRANCLGMLNAQEKMTGYVNLANYDHLFNQIQVVEV